MCNTVTLLKKAITSFNSWTKVACKNGNGANLCSKCIPGTMEINLPWKLCTQQNQLCI